MHLKCCQRDVRHEFTRGCEGTCLRKRYVALQYAMSVQASAPVAKSTYMDRSESYTVGFVVSFSSWRVNDDHIVRETL